MAEETEKQEKLTSKDTTETRILITEDRTGNFKVEYQTLIKGTEVSVPIRFSHLLGQLFLAAFILTIRNYKNLLGLGKSNHDSED